MQVEVSRRPFQRLRVGAKLARAACNTSLYLFMEALSSSKFQTGQAGVSSSSLPPAEILVPSSPIHY